MIYLIALLQLITKHKREVSKYQLTDGIRRLDEIIE